MVSLHAAMDHAHRVNANVRQAAADRSNRQGELDLMAVGHRGPFAMDFNLLASSPIRPWHEAAVIGVAAKKSLVAGSEALLSSPCRSQTTASCRDRKALL